MSANLQDDASTRIERATYRYSELSADSALLMELLNSEEVLGLFESYYKLLKIPMAIIDLQANVLFSSRWQRICTGFHRIHPQTHLRCIESDTCLAKQLNVGTTYSNYFCKNGLMDCASPIYIEGRHAANFFIGQFFPAPPDEAFFRRQAAEFGFDVDDYLAAVRDVPIVDEEKLPLILDVLVRMTRLTTDLGLDRKCAVDSEARQTLMINTVPQAIAWKDRDGHYLGCNLAFARTAQLDSPQDIIGKTDFDLLLFRERAQAYQADDRHIIATDQPRYHVIEQRADPGASPAWFDTSRLPLRDAAGHTVGILTVSEDITLRKQTELELNAHREHLEDLVASRTAEMESAKDRAEAANKAKSVFLANMSHELRTPLNAILGFSQIMSNHAEALPNHRAMLEIIEKSGEHLLELINDILDLAKIEAGKIEVEASSFDLASLLNDLTAMLRVRAEAKGLQLTLDPASSFPRFVKTDSAKLRQIVINLVGNAIKFTEQGEVSIAVSALALEGPEQKGQLLFQIRDTGSGIAPENLDRIFQPFEQVRQRELNQGTGLGLTITRGFIGLLGGSITVDSAPGKGSTFCFVICYDPAEIEEIAPRASSNKTVIGAENAACHRVLIVEDQFENRLLLRTLLEKFGFQLREALNGQEAIAAAKEWAPHLILMDRRMPVMDGLTATREIHGLPECRDIPIIAVTAHAFREEQREMLDTGCCAFLRKPFKEQDLYMLMEQHLNIRFQYAESPEAARATAEEATDIAESLADLPEAVKRDLEAALVTLDITEVALVIGRIAKFDPALGERLEREASQFAYSELLDALQKSKEILE